ncbi:uncharacterized protein LOC143277039 [Babylonia areolata]|uniref:uncharacterized protein LOC143277039 n=1 Tax=Babylonia areolata TaxID=304850 RepID=UPI003FD60F27
MRFLYLTAVLAVVAAAEWGSLAHAQKDGQALPVPDLSGALGPKSCVDLRDSLERMLYVTFKGSLPRRMLKEVLPGLVDPLLPVMCLHQAGTKWLQQQGPPTSTSARPHSRTKRNIFWPFLAGMAGMTGASSGATKVKDPGDHPPPGMTRNPFKDPGDRPMTLFGMPIKKIKDPGDHPPPAMTGGGEAPPPGEPVPMNPMMSSMLAMMQMMNFNRQMAALTGNNRNGNNGSNNGSNGGAGSSSGGGKLRNGRYFGDIFPTG